MELGINDKEVFASIPKIRKQNGKERQTRPNTDTSVNSKCLLCPIHIERLIAIIERQGDKAPMKALLKGNPPQIISNKNGCEN